MRIGVIKERRPDEYRVAITPSGVETLVEHEHQLLVESGAGLGSGFNDALYAAAGAVILPEVTEIWERAEMMVKVQEPQPHEYALMRPGQIICAFFHLAASPPLMQAVLESGCVAIAYETVETPDGHLPLLAPMSIVAGRMAIHQGIRFLERSQGGRGLLLGGVPGVEPATILILGGGRVGSNAARMAATLGARVLLLDVNPERIHQLSSNMPPNVVPLMFDRQKLRETLLAADVVISAILTPGAKTPQLITREMLRRMHPGSVMVAVDINQGGTLETSHPTTHSRPTFELDGIVHYCVGNMPGAVPMTATPALTGHTLPYILELANQGVHQAAAHDPALYKGINAAYGHLTSPPVAETFDHPWISVEKALTDQT
ncbi:MAG: alanine dehydrogenase [Magnetococcales bacterium]|nr:alanine dehydrogenase [Magnetococcales bacterium]MBF0323113.1 alanine dehydrogenase [Magnetococcales bacterium]